MYVEADFLIALTKSDDWLQEQAQATLADDSVDVHSSLLAYAELLIQAYEPDEGIGFDVPRVVANLLEEVPIVPESDEEAALAAATYLDEHQITPFDALHAGLTVTRDERIHSSDRVYDELGLDHVPLEPPDDVAG